MTEESIQEINERVAGKLGWSDIRIVGSGGNYVEQYVGGRKPGQIKNNPSRVPNYAERIEDAWEIVDLKDHAWQIFRYLPAKDRYRASVFFGKQMREADADTPSLAICLAFLALEG